MKYRMTSIRMDIR